MRNFFFRGIREWSSSVWRDVVRSNALSGDASIVSADIIDTKKRRYEDVEKTLSLSSMKEVNEQVLKDLENVRLTDQ